MRRSFELIDFTDDIYSRDEAQFIEKDYRKMVSDNQIHIHPFNAIGKIKCRMYSRKTQNYLEQYATGTIIGRNLILTSAHIFYFRS